MAGSIEGEGDLWIIGIGVIGGQNAGFDQCLKPVADTQHRFAGSDKFTHLLGKVIHQIEGE